MQHHHDDDEDERLRALLQGAVADVRPADRLGEIRRRTRGPQRRRHWWPVVLGAGVATAAVVAGGVVVARIGDDAARQPPTAGSPEPASRATPLYFLGDSPTGPRLYREFQQLPAEDDDATYVASALQRLTATAGPDDPDYRTVWPGGAFGNVEVATDAVTVEVEQPALQRPAGVPAGTARLALQQVVYTAEAVIGETLPVVFEDGDQPAGRVLGVKTPGEVARDRQYDVVAPVNISDPVEGETADDELAARGTASDWVSSVDWTLRDSTGADVDGGSVGLSTDGQGTLGFPGWELDPVPVDDLAPGDYTFEVRVREIGQTSDAPATYLDTRTVVVR